MAIYGIWTKHKGADKWNYSGRTFSTHKEAKVGLIKYKTNLKKMGADTKWMDFKVS